MARFTRASARALWVALCFLAAACAPYVVPEGPPQAKPAFTLDGFRTEDGLMLPFLEWGPQQNPTAVVLGLHGFGDYSNAFNAAAGHFAKQGIATYAYDQRGFGNSPGRGLWHGRERLAKDAADAVDALAALYPGVPVFLMGHSMGGAIAMNAAALYPQMQAKGLILVAPAVWSRAYMPRLNQILLHASAHTLPWYPLTGQGIRVTPTDDIAVLRKLSRDPKVLRAFRVDQVWGLTNAMDQAQASASHIPMPSLFLYGLKDDIVPLPPTQAAIGQIQPGLLRVGVYEDGYHLLLRSRVGETVVADIAHWLQAPGTPLPSGADKDWQNRLFHR